MKVFTPVESIYKGGVPRQSNKSISNSNWQTPKNNRINTQPHPTKAAKSVHYTMNTDKFL